MLIQLPATPRRESTPAGVIPVKPGTMPPATVTEMPRGITQLAAARTIARYPDGFPPIALMDAADTLDLLGDHGDRATATELRRRLVPGFVAEVNADGRRALAAYARIAEMPPVEPVVEERVSPLATAVVLVAAAATGWVIAGALLNLALGLPRVLALAAGY